VGGSAAQSCSKAVVTIEAGKAWSTAKQTQASTTVPPVASEQALTAKSFIFILLLSTTQTAGSFRKVEMFFWPIDAEYAKYGITETAFTYSDDSRKLLQCERWPKILSRTRSVC
jgi:hypothetical protein